MIKIAAINDPSKDEEHPEDETITQVTKEAQVNQKVTKISSSSINVKKLFVDCRRQLRYQNTCAHFLWNRMENQILH